MGRDGESSRGRPWLAALLLCAVLAACSSSTRDGDADADVGADTDIDIDADADLDAEVDAAAYRVHGCDAPSPADWWEIAAAREACRDPGDHVGMNRYARQERTDVVDRAQLEALGGTTALARIDCYRCARSCPDFEACDRPSVAMAVRCARNLNTKYGCAGDDLVMCDQGQLRAFFECSQLGQICREDDAGVYAQCGVGTCEPGADLDRCDGEDKLACHTLGVWERTSCAEAVCQTTPGGMALCRGDGAECAEHGATRCEGNVLVTCRLGREARLDCARQDPLATCVNDHSCGYADEQCGSYDDETCADGVISVCDFRRHLRSLDCRALGFAGCASGERGSQVISWCTP